MDKKRKVYAPFSLTSEAGVAQTPVEGYIDVNQTIYPTVNTGTINEKGRWTGVRSNDPEFMGFTTHLHIADGTLVLCPSTNNHPSINMEGFSHLQFVVKSNTTAATRIDALAGPSTTPTLNVTLEAAHSPKIAGIGDPVSDIGFADALFDASETIVGDFRLFTVFNRLKDMPNVQIALTNNAGAERDYFFAFRRLI